MSSDQESLPDNLLELETAYKELEITVDKLKESTDLLTEEFRKADGDEAKEYYEYVIENLDILKAKNDKMQRIQDRIATIRGVFKPRVDASSTSSGAGGLLDGQEQGHFI